MILTWIDLPVFFWMGWRSRHVFFLCSAVRGRSEDTGTENVRTKAGSTTDWEGRVRSRGCRLGWLSQDREVETLLRFLRTVRAELALPDMGFTPCGVLYKLKRHKYEVGATLKVVPVPGPGGTGALGRKPGTNSPWNEAQTMRFADYGEAPPLFLEPVLVWVFSHKRVISKRETGV